MSDLLWYASYGSNMSRDRFLCYLQGGRPRYAHRTYPGATDTTPPLDDRPVTLPHRMCFARRSTVWDGAVAFVDPGRGSGACLGRMYLVTEAQFHDVVVQENWRDDRAGALNVDLDHARAVGHHVAGDGWYETLLHCGEADEIPVFTVTASWDWGAHGFALPTIPYVRCIAEGLAAIHGMGVVDTARYLSGVPGIAGHVTAGHLVADLSGGEPPADDHVNRPA